MWNVLRIIINVGFFKFSLISLNKNVIKFVLVKIYEFFFNVNIGSLKFVFCVLIIKWK